MKIRCVVMDDEPIALEKMCSYVEKIPYLELVAACDSPVEAMGVLSREDVDVLFTDISMPGINGMDFVSALPKTPLVVFITSYSEYAVESYKVGAVDYIMKPYGMKEFQRAAEKVRLQFGMQGNNSTPMEGNDSIFIRTDYKWVRVNTSNIKYIQSLSDYLRVSFSNGTEPIITYSTFANMKSCLPNNFIQVHRSWMVNIEHIREISNSRIVMDKDTFIPVGDSYKEQLLDVLDKCSVGKSGGRLKL